ncbi:hypothetical protein WA158_001425 [Blastocystis sp. Blastoise]
MSDCQQNIKDDSEKEVEHQKLPKQTEFFDKEGNPISKSQYKKQIKQEKLKEHWVEKKKQKKEQKKLRIAEQKSNDPQTSERKFKEEDRLMNKKQWHQVWEERLKEGRQFVIDCSFEHLMEEGEITSLCQQIMFTYGLNRKKDQPFQIMISSFDGKLKDKLTHIGGFDSWKMTFDSRPFEEIYPKEKIVYFTADSNKDLDHFEKDKVYIIGGIVDRNRYPHLTLEKAEQLGIETVRLPLQAIEQLSTARVLTVNNMFEILHLFQSSNDWDEAISKGLPSRKRNKENESSDTNNNE